MFYVHFELLGHAAHSLALVLADEGEEDFGEDAGEEFSVDVAGASGDVFADFEDVFGAQAGDGGDPAHHIGGPHHGDDGLEFGFFVAF